jgi:hypothetical protein
MKALEWYREFVYQVGGKKLENKAGISEELVNDVLGFHGKLGIGERLQKKGGQVIYLMTIN